MIRVLAAVAKFVATATLAAAVTVVVGRAAGWGV